MPPSVDEETGNASNHLDVPKKEEHVVGGEDAEEFDMESFRSRFPSLLYDRAGLVVVVMLAVLFLMIGILAAAEAFAMSEQTEYNFQVHDDPIVKDWFALDRAEKFVTVGSGEGIEQVNRTIDLDKWGVITLYRGRSSNILTKEALDRMRTIEARIYEREEYQDFCLSEVNGTCSDGSYQSVLELIPESYNQSQIDTLVQGFAQEIEDGTERGIAISGFFGRDFTVANPRTRYLRAFYRYGGPLVGYRNTEDKEEKQEDLFESYIEPHVDRTVDSSNSRFESFISGAIVWNIIFNRLIAEDLGWAFFSMIFVFLFMIYHTKSLFLASMGILEILLAFPFAFYFYNIIFQIDLFESLHVMSVFIILGIGADDIFVFVDAWHQALVYEELRDDDTLRMCWVWKRASATMLVTSVTTCGAFLATGISSIAPIAAFGIWAACLIAANYMLVITFFPACVALYHKHTRFCCSKLKKSDVEEAKAERMAAKKQQDDNIVMVKPTVDTPKPVKTKDAHSSSAVELADINKKTSQTDLTDVPLEEKNEDEGPNVELSRSMSRNSVSHSRSLAESAAENDELRAIERFFYFKWAPLIHKARYYILAFFAVFIIASIAIAAQIKPLSEEEQWLPDDHFLTQTFDMLDNKFVKSEFDNIVKVQIVWGIKGIDRSDTNRWDTADLGRVVFDKTFDVSSGPAQQHIIDSCEKLRNSSIVFQRIVNCFMEDYKQWREDDGETFPAIFSADPDEQRANFTSSLKQFALEYRTERGIDYEADFSIGIDPSTGDLKFVKIDSISPLAPFKPYSITKPVYNKWKAMVDTFNDDAPNSDINKAYQTAKEYWGQMITEQEIVKNAMQGMGIALSVAFVALTLSTQNIVMSLYAIGTIMGIVATVTATMVLQGWELGISQSVAVVLLIGFSVDYVVHLANAYIESSRSTRFEKMQDSLTTMGISVVSGAATTFGASLFLYGTTILFFVNFAIIMSTTVCFALFYSLTFFTTLCISFGPEGTTGDLKHYAKLLMARIKEKRAGK